MHSRLVFSSLAKQRDRRERFVSSYANVSSKPWPACFCVLEPIGVFLNPVQHVKKAPRSLLIPFLNGLVAEVSYFVQIRRLDVALGISRDRSGSDPSFSKPLLEFRPGLVE